MRINIKNDENKNKKTQFISNVLVAQRHIGFQFCKKEHYTAIFTGIRSFSLFIERIVSDLFYFPPYFELPNRRSMRVEMHRIIRI